MRDTFQRSTRISSALISDYYFQVEHREISKAKI